MSAMPFTSRLSDCVETALPEIPSQENNFQDLICTRTPGKPLPNTCPNPPEESSWNQPAMAQSTDPFDRQSLQDHVAQAGATSVLISKNQDNGIRVLFPIVSKHDPQI